ncbi:DEAD/DEAH box helicase [Geodermatophilus sp. TF02-6]|uniref:type I restriction endonuclease subunit R n=1 Tax=Geodermatophilus sp. TF02-6 TaxID=2250575 RepID=UPI000DE9912F|nr:type I restriction endonuclease subunit R [Geodermatophilus sp. TF02-6]RBY81697.1 DEAD/DEAH box helicase [Geodermatophilus sp. TF02-6]
MTFTEADWEAIALDQFAEHGWQHVEGKAIAPGTDNGRTSWSDLFCRGRLLAAVHRLNPQVPLEFREQAVADILAPQSADSLAENFQLHQIMVGGFRGLTYTDADGVEQNPTIRVISHRIEENEYLAAGQVTIRDHDVERRFDVVLYLNGIPVLIVELKRAGAEHADLSSAHAQLVTYLREFPLAFRGCVLTVITDGIAARYGTPFTPLNHYAPWNVDDDGIVVATGDDPTDQDAQVALDVLIDGLANQERFGQLLRNFVAFDEVGDGWLKRVAKPHQYFAVTKAVGSTVDAVRSDGRAGVVWHTQGSGKSMEMELYAHAVAEHPQLGNPTLIVVTDRTELDDQLYTGFTVSRLLRESPVQVGTREELRSALADRNTGGIYFTTLQKFGRTDAERQTGQAHPLLSDRRNVIVIVDEAHRSHYDDLDGFARHIRDALPHATFIAFTGTPIAQADRNTAEVFGPVIDTYDLTRAVTDGATVPVVFEPRLITVERTADVTAEDLDAAADEATTGLDDVERARVEAAVTALNAVYGAPARLKTLAADIVKHWERRRAAVRPFLGRSGRAMIVGATREICARLYDEIVALRPDWHSDALDSGVIKVVYSGNATDQPPVSAHVRRGSQNKVIQARLKEEAGEDPLELVIVQNMMLTGFDAPPLHTLYLDRPLRGALLMQTLARVNRTFRAKDAGLLVAYAPITENLAAALAEYTVRDHTDRPVGRDVEESVELTRRLVGELDALSAGYPWRSKLTGDKRSYRDALLGLTNYVRSPATPGNQVGEDQKPLVDRFRELANSLSRAWALAAGGTTLPELRAAAQFYEEVRVWMGKFDAAARMAEGRPVPAEIELMLAGLVASSTATGEILDIYEAAGMERPKLTDLTPEYTASVQEAANPHLAIEALRDLLVSESDAATQHNLVRQRAFSQRLQELMNKYTNQQLTSAEIIAAMIEMAHDVAAEADRGASFDPPLSVDELAFYDAVSSNESAVDLQGSDVLANIARDLVAVMRRDVKTDWTVRDDVRAKLRSSIKRLLVSHNYPPDQQPEAIRLVIEQMEAMAPRFAA